MRRALNHMRANAVAYIALFVALGGTGYAATSLPAGSVGVQQIRNHVITPGKFNPRFIRGSVRLWAGVSAAGRLVAGGGGAKLVPPTGAADAGIFALEPSRGSRTAIPRRCAVVASVDDSSPLPGIANGEVKAFSKGTSPRWQVVVETYDTHGVPTSLPFDVAVIC